MTVFINRVWHQHPNKSLRCETTGKFIYYLILRIR